MGYSHDEKGKSCFAGCGRSHCSGVHMLYESSDIGHATIVDRIPNLRSRRVASLLHLFPQKSPPVLKRYETTLFLNGLIRSQRLQSAYNSALVHHPKSASVSSFFPFLTPLPQTFINLKSLGPKRLFSAGAYIAINLSYQWLQLLYRSCSQLMYRLISFHHCPQSPPVLQGNEQKGQSRPSLAAHCYSIILLPLLDMTVS